MANGIIGGNVLSGSALSAGDTSTPPVPGSGAGSGGVAVAPADGAYLLWTADSRLTNARAFGGPVVAGTAAPTATNVLWLDQSVSPAVLRAYVTGAWQALTTAGATGPQGLSVLAGSAAPTGATGVDGDLYLLTTTGALYQRSGGAWSVVGSLVGPAGPVGAAGAEGQSGAWLTGSGDPNTGEGVDGNLYFDVVTSNVWQKSAGAWSVIANIAGPAAHSPVTSTTSAFTLSTPCTIAVADSTAFLTGGVVLLSSASSRFSARVTAVSTGTLTLSPLGLSGDAASGTVFPVGTSVAVTGEPGATGSGGGSGGATSLDSLTGVSIVSPTDGQALIYSAASALWENAAIPYYEPMTNGNPSAPDLYYDGSGDIVMG